MYNQTGQTVAIGQPFDFDTNGVMTSGITHTAGGSGITLASAGDYKVTFSVSGDAANQVGLSVDGGATIVAGSVYGSAAGAQQNTGQVIVRTAAAGTVLTLRALLAAVTVSTPLGGSVATVNASVGIEKLN